MSDAITPRELSKMIEEVRERCNCVSLPAGNWSSPIGVRILEDVSAHIMKASLACDKLLLHIERNTLDDEPEIVLRPESQP
jgi:hypothetical protein